ncbi:MAG: DUF45 domain-containing protein [Coriobacteriia bacterium]|nr:DUF45 domain-containing protein [Coriobacteriia bacterium]
MLVLGGAPLARAAGLPPAVSQALREAGIPERSVALFLQAVDGGPALLSHNARQAMNPASVMKLLTTYAGLELLGPAHTWRSEALADTSPASGRLDGNLYLRGSGDPKLGLEQFWLLLRQLRGRGLSEIGGDLVLDRSAFALPPHDPGEFDNEPLRPYNAGPDALLPDIVELRAFGEAWPVEYRVSSASGCQARLAGGMLVVVGDIDDGEACLAALSRWLDRVARERLLPLLADVAAEVGLGYESARVRHVRSRWGSCSAKRTISLNRALVFMPPHLVGALMLHELAHTLVMNHSPKFHATLATLDPCAEEHRRQLKDAGRFLPPWAEL